MPLAAAVLVFVALVTLIVGIWWVAAERRKLSERLADAARLSAESAPQVLREPPSRLGQLVAHARFYRRAERLLQQAGLAASPVDLVLVMAAFAIGGGFLAWLRTDHLAWGLIGGLIGPSLPWTYLLFRRQRRFQRFQELFADALDMMTRSLRAGYALSGSIKLVGDEAPEPIGVEFRRVSEEVRLGVDPGEALAALERRVPIEDVQFFATAVRIQRAAGGNLTEILDRLSEVIRERFKLLAHARALSAQHRWSAVCVGLSPIVFSLMAQFLQPGYFNPLLESPLAPFLIGSGLVLEFLGFFAVWRIANIRV